MATHRGMGRGQERGVGKTGPGSTVDGLLTQGKSKETQQEGPGQGRNGCRCPCLVPSCFTSPVVAAHVVGAHVVTQLQQEANLGSGTRWASHPFPLVPLIAFQ